MKKKLIAMLLATSMVCGVLAGCGSSGGTTQDTASTPTTESGDESTDAEASTTTASDDKTADYVAGDDSDLCYDFQDSVRSNLHRYVCWFQRVL